MGVDVPTGNKTSSAEISFVRVAQLRQGSRGTHRALFKIPMALFKIPVCISDISFTYADAPHLGI